MGGRANQPTSIVSAPTRRGDDRGRTPADGSNSGNLEPMMEPAAAPSPQPEWLTTAGLSEMLGGVSVSTIRGWRLAGIGPPHVKLGGLVRYQRAEVERWIAAGGDRRDSSGLGSHHR